MVGALVTVSCKWGDVTATLNQLQGDPYPLDERSRDVVTEAGKVVCPDVTLVDYPGTELKFVPPLRITSVFLPRIRRFESIVVEVAERHYGRKPSTVAHAGGYVCRGVEHRRNRYSEHALGNALDVVGFKFGPLKPLPTDKSARTATLDVVPIPQKLRASFRVNVASHWNASSPPDANHTKFLRDLIDTLIERGVFRAVIGPGAPGHHDHFHFDMAPWAYVDIDR
jgi:hypothetical protein